MSESGPTGKITMVKQTKAGDSQRKQTKKTNDVIVLDYGKHIK